jgi:hypothetical protein
MPRLCFGKSVGQVCSAGRDMELLELAVVNAQNDGLGASWPDVPS